MNSTFPFVKGRDWGYYPEDVDTFISTARKIYDETFSQMTPGLPPGHAAIKAKDIRQVSFRRTRGGYSTQHVDDALDRLESVFLDREKAVFISQSGESAWNEHLAHERAAIVEHASRKPKQLFRRVGSFSSGYSVSQVRLLVEKIRDHFVMGSVLTAQEVRTVQFASKKRGYNENQVDAFLDAVINVLAYEDPGAPLEPLVPPVASDTAQADTAAPHTAPTYAAPTYAGQTGAPLAAASETEDVVSEQSPIIDAPYVPLTQTSVASAEAVPANEVSAASASASAVAGAADADAAVSPAAAAVAAMWMADKTAESSASPETPNPAQTFSSPQTLPAEEAPAAPYVPPIVPGSYASAAAEWASGGTGPVNSPAQTDETIPAAPVYAVPSSSTPDPATLSSEVPISEESKSDEKPDEDDFFAQFK